MFNKFGMMLLALGLSGSAVLAADDGDHKIADDKDRTILVHNLGQRRIDEMYASPSNQKEWTYNMLDKPSKWIRPRQIKIVNMDDGSGECIFDIKMVANDLYEYKNLHVDICKTGHLYIMPDIDTNACMRKRK